MNEGFSDKEVTAGVGVERHDDLSALYPVAKTERQLLDQRIRRGEEFRELHRPRLVGVKLFFINLLITSSLLLYVGSYEIFWQSGSLASVAAAFIGGLLIMGVCFLYFTYLSRLTYRAGLATAPIIAGQCMAYLGALTGYLLLDRTYQTLTTVALIGACVSIPCAVLLRHITSRK